jgi:predicted dehydrogenase
MKNEYSGAGALMDLGVHLIDTMRFILGDVKNVEATLHTRFRERCKSLNSSEKVIIDADEYSLLNVVLQNGAIGTLECSRIASDLDEETKIEIYGTLGSIKISTRDPYYPVIHDQKSNTTINGITPKGNPFYDHLMKIYPSEKFSQGQFMDTHIASLHNMFINTVNGKILYPETPTFHEAAKSQEIIDMALKNSRVI